MRPLYVQTCGTLFEMKEIYRDMLRGRHSAVTDPSLKVRIEKGRLWIAYPSKTNSVIFDISNANGQVLLKGELDSETEENELDISGLRNGNYMLYLIDGSELIKFPFTCNN